LRISKIQDGGGRHLEKSNNRNYTAMDWRKLMKFGTTMLSQSPYLDDPNVVVDRKML